MCVRVPLSILVIEFVVEEKSMYLYPYMMEVSCIFLIVSGMNASSAAHANPRIRLETSTYPMEYDITEDE